MSFTHTCWYKIIDGKKSYNHLSDGYDPNATKPIWKYPATTNVWKNQEWIAVPAELIDGRIKEFKE